MYFISNRTINAGEELTIDFGKDYWDERRGFGEMSKIENPIKSENEGMGLPQNAATQAEEARKMQFGQPNSTLNPAISGIAITSSDAQS